MYRLGLIVIFMSNASILFAQEVDTTKVGDWSISGYGGIYYKHNFNNNVTDNKTSFTYSNNSFEIGMLSVMLRHSVGKVSFTADVGWGKRAAAFSYHDKETSVAIKQLYMDYHPVSWLKLTAGSFATFIGYEMADANLNRNYSMSYMFSYGPFFHTGVKAEATVGNHSFMLGVFNPTDYKYAPLGSKKYFGGQWGYHPEGSPFHFYLNYLGGCDTAGIKNSQIDLVLKYKVSSHFNIAYNGTYSHYSGSMQRAKWWGSALYLNVDYNKSLGFTLRSEYFVDKDNLKVFTDKTDFRKGGAIWSFTLSSDYQIGAITLIPEVRIDYATKDIFSKNIRPKNHSANILIAAIYNL